MEHILDVADYMCRSYAEQTGRTMDELKLHKLLYFAQRESIALMDEPLFSETFEGWVHGPVSTVVRSHFENGQITEHCSEIAPSSKRIVNNIICEYGTIDSWKLRNLSHDELSWKNSRRGLSETENGNHSLAMEDIRKDAEKVRPFDYTWGMYYDEFDDAEGNSK